MPSTFCFPYYCTQFTDTEYRNHLVHRAERRVDVVLSCKISKLKYPNSATAMPAYTAKNVWRTLCDKWKIEDTAYAW